MSPTKRITLLLDRYAHAGTVHDISITKNHITLDGERYGYRGIDHLPNRIEFGEVRNSGGRAFIDLHLIPSIRPLPRTGKSVGVDLGVFHLAYTSDGNSCKSHKDLVRVQKLIEKQEKERSRCDWDSSRYNELTRCIERNQDRLFDRQLNQAEQVARRLVRDYDVICCEAINPSGQTIRNDPAYDNAAKRINWQLLIDVLALRSHEAERELVLVAPFGTSTECSQCRQYVPKPLTQREHHCPYCGYTANRDRNAAEVILKRGLEIRDGSQRTWWSPPGHPKYRAMPDDISFTY